MNKALKVKCPQCETIFFYYQSPSRPFCSERCKMIDLGHWFEESYRVPEKELVINEVNNEKNNNEKENEQENYQIDSSDEDYDKNEYE